MMDHLSQERGKEKERGKGFTARNLADNRQTLIDCPAL